MSRAKALSLAVVLLVALAGVSLVVWSSRDTVVNGETSGAGETPAARAVAASAPRAARAVALPEEARGKKLLTPMAAVAEPVPPGTIGGFEGRVVSWSTGEGVEGAEVTFDVGGVAETAMTGADGGFRFVPAQPGEVRLAMIAKDGYLPFAPDWEESPIALSAREGTGLKRIVFFLYPAIDYRGTVLSPEGRPVAGAQVLLRLPEPLLSLSRPIRSDRDGTFTFNAPDGTVLEARHPDYDPGRAVLDSAAAIAHALTIRLEPKGSAPDRSRLAISGTVVDAGGEPIVGAKVKATRGPDAPEPEVETDEQGRFSLDGLDPGRYALTARKRGFGPAEAPGVEAGTTAARLVLTAGGVIVGSVHRSDGGPAAAFTVVVQRPLGALQRAMVTAESFLDAAGAFRIDSLAPGPYVLVAVAAGLAPGEEVSVTVPEPPDEAHAELSLRQGAVARGTIVDRDTNQPLAHARANIESGVNGAGSPLPYAPTALTGDDGAFVLEGIPPGPCSILAEAYQHHPRIIGGLVAVEGGEIDPMVIDLQATKPGEEPRVELAGIGAALRAVEDALVVDRVIDGGGAGEAGLVPGDALLTIDGVPVTDLGFNGAIQRIRGAENTVVRLRVRHADGTVEEMAVARRRIRA